MLLLSVWAIAYAGLENGGINIRPLREGTKLGIGGEVSMECGQFINSFYLNGQLYDNRPWLLRSKGRLDLQAAIGSHLTIKLSPEILLWYDTYPVETMGNEAFKYPYNQHSDVYFAQAQGIVNIALADFGEMNLVAGVFPYKYNRDTKNLGEYLFRTGARPAYISTDFDFAYARLTGFWVNGIFRDGLFTADCMLTSETKVLPTRDWSLSLLAGFHTAPFSASGGIMFDRLIPVDHSMEKPEIPQNKYLTEDNEEKYMSFGGTKIAVQLSFDPKPLLSSTINDVFGENDAKIYSEIAILGTQNFTAYKYYFDTNTGLSDTNRLVVDSAMNYYDDVAKRIPIMFGVTIPTFKLLDYLSLELEYYGWAYPNSTGRVYEFKQLLPHPAQKQSEVPIETFELDNWKYSLNFKKTVVQGFSVIGQLARDHTRHDYFYKGYLDMSEALVKTDNIEKFGDLFNPAEKWGAFGWWLKLQYQF